MADESVTDEGKKALANLESLVKGGGVKKKVKKRRVDIFFMALPEHV